MEEARRPTPDNRIGSGLTEPEIRYHAMQQILSQPDRPTAVFAAAILWRCGSALRADEMGLAYRSDVSATVVMTMCVTPVSLPPALTTIHQAPKTL